MLTSLYVHLHTAWITRTPVRPADAERGQASAEYALVLLGAAAVALLIVSWATHTNKIGGLLDTVLDKVRDQVR